LADELGGEMKNPLGLNQAEIIAGLALELVKSSKRVINPVTKQPFRVKFGREKRKEDFSFVVWRKKNELSVSLSLFKGFILVQLLEESSELKIFNTVYLGIPLIQ
jgi:hypothetical protein